MLIENEMKRKAKCDQKRTKGILRAEKEKEIIV